MNYTISGDGKSITCNRCGRTSYNLNDVKHKYCGHCHVFHEDQDPSEIGSPSPRPSLPQAREEGEPFGAP